MRLCTFFNTETQELTAPQLVEADASTGEWPKIGASLEHWDIYVGSHTAVIAALNADGRTDAANAVNDFVNEINQAE